MPRSGPRKVYRYSDEFTLTAVRLSHQPGMQVQTVAAALEIHPFMLSKWRKDVKDGRLRGTPRKRRPRARLARSPSCRPSSGSTPPCRRSTTS